MALRMSAADLRFSSSKRLRIVEIDFSGWKGDSGCLEGDVGLGGGFRCSVTVRMAGNLEESAVRRGSMRRRGSSEGFLWNREIIMLRFGVSLGLWSTPLPLRVFLVVGESLTEFGVRRPVARRKKLVTLEGTIGFARVGEGGGLVWSGVTLGAGRRWSGVGDDPEIYATGN